MAPYVGVPWGGGQINHNILGSARTRRVSGQAFYSQIRPPGRFDSSPGYQQTYPQDRNPGYVSVDRRRWIAMSSIIVIEASRLRPTKRGEVARQDPSTGPADTSAHCAPQVVPTKSQVGGPKVTPCNVRGDLFLVRANPRVSHKNRATSRTAVSVRSTPQRHPLLTLRLHADGSMAHDRGVRREGRAGIVRVPLPLVAIAAAVHTSCDYRSETNCPDD